MNYNVQVNQRGLYPVQLSYDKQQIPQGTVGVKVYADGESLGTVDQGGAGPQGDSPNPDYLAMEMLTQPMIETEVLKNDEGKSITVMHNMLNNNLSIH